MLTDSKESANGAIFHLSSPNSAFGKVYQNNMDENSYRGKETMQTALSNPRTAVWYSYYAAGDTKEYLDCKVRSMRGSLIFIHLNRLLDLVLLCLDRLLDYSNSIT